MLQPASSGRRLSLLLSLCRSGSLGAPACTQDFQNRALDVFPDGAITLSYSAPKRWIAGGMIELRLPLHLAIEADGLYHELEYIMSASVTANRTVRKGSPGPVVTWEIPVLAKYRFSFPMANPFVEAGPSFRASYNLNGTYPSNHGLTAGVGVKRMRGGSGSRPWFATRDGHETGSSRQSSHSPLILFQIKLHCS